jgi:Carboxypeptidase regulatory-like domain/TonB dependent receptor-like, beta-barrel
MPGGRAQTSLVGAALDGFVSDSAGARLPQVTVTVLDPGRRRVRQAVTSADGSFQIEELPPGTYQLSVSQRGFAPYLHSGLQLELGTTTHLEIVLRLAGVTTQVTVSAPPPPIDPAQTAVSSSIDRERIEELPVESRNYLNFALLAPGVAASAQQPGKRSLAPLPDSGFTFGGLRGRSNTVSIDGLDNNDEYVGSSRTELSLETVQEFEVVNAGLSAEVGGASGGSINVVTRTGANDLHGDAFLFVQNGALDARDPFQSERAQPDLRRYRMGLALGGPLVRDRTFYYAAFEQESHHSLEDSLVSPAVAASVNGILAARAFSELPTGRLTEGYFPAARAETEASAKVNHQLTPGNALMLRYAFTNNREAGDAFNTAGWTDASARGSSFTLDQAVAGAWTTVFGAQSVGDLRFQLAGRRATLRTNDAAGPGVDIAGLVEFGRPYLGNGTRTERHAQVNYSFTRGQGRHIWKAGATVNHVGEDSAMADGFGGTYMFTSLADFAAGRPNEFRQAFGVIGLDYGVTSLGAFFTDHWKAARKLAVDLGVRYDTERLPGGFRQDVNNLSPRIGLAYHPARRWLLRAGYGIFYDRYVLAALNRPLQKDGAGAFEQVLTGAAAISAWQAGGSLHAPAAGVPLSIYTADAGLATPYSQQANLSLQHQLARNLTITATYLLVRGVKLSRTRNLAFPQTAGGPTAVSGWADIYQLEDSASSTYHGVSLSLNRRMSDELEFSGSYSFSKTLDDASDFYEQPQNPWNLRAERALSRQDQRHRLVFNALWELPAGQTDHGQASRNWVARAWEHLEVAPIVTVESGRPADPLTGADSNGSHPWPLSARPPGFGRNSLETPLTADIDLRILKYFPFGETAHLDVVAEAFNLLNRANVAQINAVYGEGLMAQPGFLQPLAGEGARRLQFSLDYEF